ncbi:DUF533 domain-containing protein [Marinivivus vitaminiproducens]|uniref:DUF533 domain-containing protein n=1 Tax=Marinivivus vitaminiproducens TaxID=3035935 RepID=UPI00279E092C|nr:DUF533 domain-containing protein [Geminicoccaceae bacterium SCSIO 64248]
MLNASRLLGALLEGGLSRSSHRRLSRGYGAGDGSLGGLANAALSMIGGSAFRRGGVAMIASIAASALERRSPPSDSYTPPPPPPAARTGAQTPEVGVEAGADAADEAAAHVVVRAMITAAKADGAVDDEELQALLGRIEEAGANEDDRAFLLAQMQAPLDVESLVREVQDHSAAIEVYTASLLAIEIDTPTERDYLRDLAHRLELSAETVRVLHEQVDAPPPA